MSPTSTPADQLAKQIEQWLLLAIAERRSPLQVGRELSGALGVGLRLFACASAMPGHEDKVIEQLAKDVLQAALLSRWHPTTTDRVQ